MAKKERSQKKIKTADNPVRVVVIGGGDKAVDLIKSLMSIKGMIIAGVCDVSGVSTATKFAKQNDIPVSTDLSGVLAGGKADIVIESSGSKEFQKVLHQILPRDTKLVDSTAADLLFRVISLGERSRAKERLVLIERLSKVFAEGYDSQNVAYPSFEIFRDYFGAHSFGLLLTGRDEDSLILVGDCDIKASCLEKLKKHISASMGESGYQTVPAKIKIYGQWRTKENKPCQLKCAKSAVMKSGQSVEGAIVMTFTEEKELDQGDLDLLDAAACEFALFIGNERIKRDLADSKARLESMLNGMSEGVVALDQDLNVSLVNPSAREILDERELRSGRPFFSTIEHPSVAKVEDMIKSGKKAVFHEAAIETNSGEKVVRIIAAPIGSSVGKPAGWIMLIADITREREMDRMKSEFISTTSHELRTPLAAIKESISLVLDGTTGDVNEQQKRFLMLAGRNIDRLATLINDILDLSKLEAGRMELRIRPCDFSEVVGQAIAPMQFLARDKGVILKEEIAGEIPAIRCDPDRITQVIVNLVGNAVKFTPNGGAITVRVEVQDNPQILERCQGKLSVDLDEQSRAIPHAGRSVLIGVADTGSGIEQKDFQKLFTKFSQLDSSLTRRPGGTGLGLSICKELVRMHGGIIWVESELGKGSTFLFTIPLD